jgi:thymidylate kinase
MIVTLSGIDGAGKTSIAGAVVEELRQRRYEAELCVPRYVANDVLKDFCETEYGDRYLYVPKLDASFYIYGVFIDWLDLLKTKLRDHHTCILVCDRWFLWDLFAQGVQYGARMEPLLSLANSFPVPDVSILLEVTPQTAYRRLLKRTSPKIHRHENLASLTELSAAFTRTTRMTGWTPHVVHTEDRSWDAVLADVVRIVLAAHERLG